MNHQQPHSPGPLSSWLQAARPRTLPAAVAPVMVGSALAYADNGFKLVPATAALLVAVLLQIGVNLANDYFDFVKGVDTPERLGPIRVTQSGLIPPDRVKSAMMLIFTISLVPGIYLVVRGGWPAALIGSASIIAALAYSGGPYPLASHALGDLFVFVFFGLVAVCGSYYVQTLGLTPLATLAGAVEGLLITGILVVNNLRDIHTDRRSGKKTLAVLIGNHGSKLEHSLLQILAYAMPVMLWFEGLTSVWTLLPFLSLPLAIRLNRSLWKSTDGRELNQALAGTAKLTLIFSLLLSIGLIVP